MGPSTHDLLVSLGYKLIDDSWERHGRRTYLHDDDADRQHFRKLAAMLRQSGWEIDTGQLRTLKHHQMGEIIEIEPGGADTSGSFLHHMKDR